MIFEYFIILDHLQALLNFGFKETKILKGNFNTVYFIVNFAVKILHCAFISRFLKTFCSRELFIQLAQPYM